MSQNYAFLKGQAPELESICGFAEQYAYSDPESALIKLRTFAEEIVSSIYQRKRFVREGTTLAELLIANDFVQATPQVVLTKLHAIRKEGNKAAHGVSSDTQKVIWLLKEARQLANWYAVQHLGIKPDALPAYQEVAPTQETSELNKAYEAELENLIEERAAEKQKYDALHLEHEALKAEQSKGQAAADSLNMSEEETRRRLIDIALIDAGWNVGKDGADTDEVGQEVEIQHTVSGLGKGFVDYVLWDVNGMPLVVIEAKKTSKSAELGKKQAELYASALEKQHGQRPVIFYTNGYDIHMWDDAQGYPPRMLFGFYSKDSLQHLVNFQRKEKKPLDSLSVNPVITGRTYQIEAIKRVCEKFEGKHRKALLVMATGTGKTRVAVSLTDLMMRTHWAKRILFLCDRKELRKQAKNAYTDHMDVSVSVGGGKGSEDDKARITVATYPGMMGKFLLYDVGYFDLIIADESHRSIYNMYLDLFKYFDCNIYSLAGLLIFL